MNFLKTSHSFTKLIQNDISNEAQQSEQNLEWLKNEMHPLFFVFNQAEVEALTLLTKSLHHMDYHKR